jgi:hypothetical protein
VALVAEFKDLVDEIFTRDDWKHEFQALLDFPEIDLNMLNDKNLHVVSYVRDSHRVAYDPGMPGSPDTVAPHRNMRAAHADAQARAGLREVDRGPGKMRTRR